MWENIEGYKLVVNITSGDTTYSYPDKTTFYDVGQVSYMSDSIRLAVIEQLLTFKNDRSKCCGNAKRTYYYEGIDRSCFPTPKTRFFTTQVEALYMINRIIHPGGISLYSCFPVIIKTDTKEEINNRPDLVADYYQVYEQLFQEAKKENRISDNFISNINTKKYSWLGQECCFY